MSSYKPPTFQERAAVAAKAKQVALDRLRIKIPIDEETVAARQAARVAREAADAEKMEARRIARESVN
jgi:hypothetical protein